MKHLSFLNPSLKLAVVLSTAFHFLAVSLTHLPENPVFGDIHHRLFRPYLGFTGSWQRWNMFTSVPSIHRFAVRLQAETKDGKKLIVGPVLPGFKALDDYVKLQTFFLTSVYFEHPSVFAYLKRACKRLEQERGVDLTHIGFLVHEEVTRDLQLVKKDKNLFSTRSYPWGRVECPQ